MQIKTKFRADQVADAVAQMYRAKVAGWTSCLKLEYDPVRKKIFLNQYADTNSWMRTETGIDLTQLATVNDDFDWTIYIENVRDFDAKKIIAETEDTVWTEMGRRATKKEIEEFEMDETRNVRVIDKLKAYDECDWCDAHEYTITRAEEKIEEADEEYERMIEA